MSLLSLLRREFGCQKFIKRFQYQLQLLCNCHMYPVVKERVTSLQDKPSMSYDWLNCHESLTKSWHHIKVIENDFLILWRLSYSWVIDMGVSYTSSSSWSRGWSMTQGKDPWILQNLLTFLLLIFFPFLFIVYWLLIPRRIVIEGTHLEEQKRDEVFTFDRQLYSCLYLEHI